MTAHRIGISGSVILTDPSKFDQLFQYGLDHIEIGEFPNMDSFHVFMDKMRKTNASFGLHSPLKRNESKYDLLEKVQMDPELAWKQFEQETAYMASLGAEYILVHFPFFQQERSIAAAKAKLEEGLKKLSKLQDQHGLPIVCEPKLGMNRSAFNIQLLHEFPLDRWAKYGLHLCIDIGDYILAAKEQSLEYIAKWKDHIKVVHLHNVEFHGEEYFWVPVHPSHEHDGVHHSIKSLLLFLAQCQHVYFIFEHTPHTNPTKQMAEEGIQWVNEVIRQNETIS